jgi:hypothetical protein
MLAVLMVVQAGLGLAFRDQYRDVEWIRATWLGNDGVTLVVAAPLLVAGLLLDGRGSRRGLLLWLGVVAYAAYNYAYYLLGAALNVFFLLYASLVVLAAVILILALARLDAAGVARAFDPATPVRMLGGYFVCVGVGLASVWMGLWAAYVFAGRPTPVEPDVFRLVAALDLTLLVTVFVSGGVLLWRQAPWGYVIAALGGVQGSLYLLVLTVNSGVAVRRGLADAPGELPVWAPLTLLTAGATLLLMKSSVARHS